MLMLHYLQAVFQREIVRKNGSKRQIETDSTKEDEEEDKRIQANCNLWRKSRNAWYRGAATNRTTTGSHLPKKD